MQECKHNENSTQNVAQHFKSAKAKANVDPMESLSKVGPIALGQYALRRSNALGPVRLETARHNGKVHTGQTPRPGAL